MSGVENGGWRDIASAPPELDKCLLFCPERVRTQGPIVDDGIVMGRTSGGQPYGNGMNGDWVFTLWQPLPPPPVTP